MNVYQGIIACSGNGTRFAQSVGKQSPYPKHLEMVGDRSILTTVVAGLVSNVPIAGITFTLNPRLVRRYLDPLKELQLQYLDVPFSYTLIDPEKEGESLLADTLRRVMRDEGTLGLDGNRTHFENPLVTFTFGDTFGEGGNSSQMRQDIQESEPHIIKGTNIIVTDGIFFGFKVYQLAVLDSLSFGRVRSRIMTARDYDMKFYNINDLADLIRAKRELGYPLTEDEISRSAHPFGKERA